MRALVQRVSSGAVHIDEPTHLEEIGPGFVILLGIKSTDNESDVNFVADKCCNLRVFEDEQEKMNKSLKDVNGEILLISQFTLYGDAQKGNRPSFTDAAKPEAAIPLYEKFIQRLKLNIGETKVKTGIFGAMMRVKIVNEGPVTILVESKNGNQ